MLANSTNIESCASLAGRTSFAGAIANSSAANSPAASTCYSGNHRQRVNCIDLRLKSPVADMETLASTWSLHDPSLPNYFGVMDPLFVRVRGPGKCKTCIRLHSPASPCVSEAAAATISYRSMRRCYRQHPGALWFSALASSTGSSKYSAMCAQSLNAPSKRTQALLAREGAEQNVMCLKCYGWCACAKSTVRLGRCRLPK